MLMHRFQPFFAENWIPQITNEVFYMFNDVPTLKITRGVSENEFNLGFRIHWLPHYRAELTYLVDSKANYQKGGFRTYKGMRGYFVYEF